MKLRGVVMSVLCTLAVALPTVGCQGASEPTPDRFETVSGGSPRVLDLYAWEDESGEWRYALMDVTGRFKMLETVYAQTPLSVDEVKEAMLRLATGDWVVLYQTVLDETGQLVDMPRPPEDVIEELKSWATDCGVNFSVPGDEGVDNG